MTTNVITGARAVFSINEIDIAIANEVSYDWRIETHPIEVVDILEVFEHVETGVRVEFSCSIFRIYNRSVIALGIMPRLKDILFQPELVVTIRDKITQSILLRIEGVKLVGRSGSMGARSAWTESLSFVGKRAFDEGDL